MASFVLTRPDVFVSGTVAAYVKPALGVPLSGAPSGSAVSSPSVSGNSVTFTGLADNTQYIAYQGTPDRYVSFRTPPASSAVSETDPIAEADLATHAALTTTAHGGIAPSASPTFTGTPAAPTATQGTNTTQVATTAYVQTEVGLVVPKSLVDAKGDVLTATADNTPARLAVGANDLVLTAASGQTSGLQWARTQADRKRRLWTPTAISGTAQSAIIDENFSRSDFTATAVAQATAVLRLHGGLVIPAGQTCAKAICYLVGAGSGLTHAWAVLTDQSGAELAITADDTSATSSALSFKTFTWTVAYPAVADTPVYVGLCWVGSGVPTVPVKTAQNIGGEVPKLGMASNTGLTDPASLGAGPVTLGTNSAPTWIALA